MTYEISDQMALPSAQIDQLFSTQILGLSRDHTGPQVPDGIGICLFGGLYTWIAMSTDNSIN
jgi:hypothetical protein